jgi:hypothetical protein
MVPTAIDSGLDNQQFSGNLRQSFNDLNYIFEVIENAKKKDNVEGSKRSEVFFLNVELLGYNETIESAVSIIKSSSPRCAFRDIPFVDSEDMISAARLSLKGEKAVEGAYVQYGLAAQILWHLDSLQLSRSVVLPWRDFPSGQGNSMPPID